MTSSRRKSIGVIALACAIFSGAAYAQAPAAPPVSGGMKQSMMAGMDMMQKMPMSGDTDKDFAMMMKMHHEQAVQMAQAELEAGKSQQMKAMARKIISAQKKEIAEFERWLAKSK
ncbi:DUF305 domain-containing protein [Variovorax robiniae]|uniref:DUF305 domain-containing protein n=1 Tax=Variovorax robiniae TaxID=1836199 RepID=A0ABU8XA27_9BURK